MKVFARFRSLTEPEELLNYQVIDHHRLVVQHKKQPLQYDFERVFDQTDDTETVFRHVVLPLIPHLLQGINVSVMLYGATGSGKTFTATSLTTLTFQHLLTQLSPETNTYLQYVQIYNEKILDLLDETPKKIDIHANPLTGVVLKNAAKLPFVGWDQLASLIEQGSHRKIMAETRCNAHSSRSHTSLMVTIEQNGVWSKVVLLDLAGSESVKASGVVERRLAEAKQINLSLSSLKGVICRLAEKAKFIPFRDSILTRMLSDTLGGNSLTAVVLTLSPLAHVWSETNSTLSFGSKAKRITNTPKINKVPQPAEVEHVAVLESQLAFWKQKFLDLEEQTRQASLAFTLMSPPSVSPASLSPPHSAVDVQCVEKEVVIKRFPDDEALSISLHSSLEPDDSASVLNDDVFIFANHDVVMFVSKDVMMFEPYAI